MPSSKKFHPIKHCLSKSPNQSLKSYQKITFPPNGSKGKKRCNMNKVGDHPIQQPQCPLSVTRVLTPNSMLLTHKVFKRQYNALNINAFY